MDTFSMFYPLAILLLNLLYPFCVRSTYFPLRSRTPSISEAYRLLNYSAAAVSLHGAPSLSFPYYRSICSFLRTPQRLQVAWLDV